MDSPNSTFEISLDSSLESIDIPGLIVNRQTQENGPTQCSNDNDDYTTFVEKIIRIYLKHPTSLECLTDWVKLLNTRLEDCDKLPPGKVQLLKLFRENRNLTDIFFYVKCDKCRKSTIVQPDQKKGLKCSHCDALLKTNETNFFVILPVEEQIVRSVKQNWSTISEFDTSDDKESESISDAHDGSILRDVLNIYKDSDINILSLCLNVDGANKFKSNSFSVWPIQLMQNFLPPHIRFLPKNIILNGLYYHKSKEDGELSFHEYLRPLINELNALSKNPIPLEIEDEVYKFKPVITHCAVDLPAKSKLLEMKQFGGYDACSFCKIPGEKVLFEKPKSNPKHNKTSPKTPNTETSTKQTKKPKYVVRYVESECSYELRDEVDTLEKMLAASEFDGNESIDGIKDVSSLVGLEHFNVVWSVSVEYMHACLQGVAKRLVSSFLNPNNSDKAYYISPMKRKTLNKKILAITPTSSIVRKPRSLKQLPNFKASEHRSMLLYYLPVCLPGCLPHVYVKHVRLLSAAVYILLKKTIPREEVNRAEQMLITFVKDHQKLFGKQDMVMVIHLMKHLAQCVRKLGPLWCHSAFPFERNNGCLLKLAVGTTDVLHQISSKYSLGQSIQQEDNTNADYNDKILLGKPITIEESASAVFETGSLEILSFENELLSVYKRITIKKNIFTSELYTRPKRSIDYFIGLKNGVVGKAKYYFYHNEEICVMLEEFDIIDSIEHIDKVLSTKRLIVAPIDDIEKKYLFMSVGLNYYIVCRPNPYENE